MIDRVNLLGVRISAINMSDAIDSVSDWIANRDPHYICVTPAHGIMDCQNNPELQDIFNDSGLTTPDGMAIVWILKLRGYSHVERVYGPELMLALCDHGAEPKWRHFFYGSAPGVAEALKVNLQSRFPKLQVVGHYSPPFRPITPQEDLAVVEMIQAAKPDILWMGISTPKQEKWMSAHINQLGVPVLIGVGAAFDYLSGKKKQAPRWIQRIGFEWLFRLFSEPNRLWRRYIRYPTFAVLSIFQLLGLKNYDD